MGEYEVKHTITNITNEKKVINKKEVATSFSCYPKKIETAGALSAGIRNPFCSTLSNVSEFKEVVARSRRWQSTVKHLHWQSVINRSRGSQEAAC